MVADVTSGGRTEGGRTEVLLAVGDGRVVSVEIGTSELVIGRGDDIVLDGGVDH